MSLKIISKEGKKFEIDNRLYGLAKGLDAFDPKEDIDFSQQGISDCSVTDQFLQLVKDFYEKNDFDAEKLKVINKITGNKLEENLVSKVNHDLMKPYCEQAVENKQLGTLLELRDGANFFGLQELLDLIHITIGTIIYCPESESEQKEYQQKWDLEDKSPEEIIEEIEKNQELFNVWDVLDQELQKQFLEKLEQTLQPPAQNNNVNPPQAFNEFGLGGGMFGAQQF